MSKTKTNKIISILLTLTMICSMFLSAFPVTAAEGEHTHPVCGATCDGDCGVEAEGHEAITWSPLSEALDYDEATGTYSSIRTYPDGEGGFDEYAFLTRGSYYLDQDIILSSTFEYGDEINLCLNGHKITLADGVAGSIISSSANTALCDCNSEELSYKFKDNGNYWDLTDSDDYDFVVTGGIITGGNPADDSTLIDDLGCGLLTDYELVMYGGNIVGNNSKFCAGGIYLGGSNTIMYGGTVQGNYCTDERECVGGIFISYPNTLNMYDGLIAHNKSINSIEDSDEYGGGVAVAGTLNMYGGEIVRNKGIGVTLSNDESQLVMLGGNIAENEGGVKTLPYSNYDEPDVVLYGKTTLGDETGSGTITISDNAGYNLSVIDSEHTIVKQLAADSKIGITAAEPTESTPVAISATGAAYAANFISDNVAYKVAANGEGLELQVKTPHDITITQQDNIKPDKETAVEGDTVTLTVTPDFGCVTDSVTVTGATTGDTVQCDIVYDADYNLVENAWSFTMPAEDVRVTATFERVMEKGNASVTVNFLDRIGNAMNVSAELNYMYTEVTEEGDEIPVEIKIASTDEQTSSWNITELGDGTYQINISAVADGNHGYVTDMGYTQFTIEEGQLVVEEVLDGDTVIGYNQPIGANGVVSNADSSNNSFSLTVGSYVVSVRADVPGLNAYIPVKLMKDNTEVEEGVTDDVYLAPGTYKILVDTESEDYTNLTDYVKFPAEGTGVEFEVTEEYGIELSDSNTVNAEFEDYGDSYEIIMLLEPKKVMTITASISTIDGESNFEEGTTIRLISWYDDGSEYTVEEIGLPTDKSSYSETWTVSSMKQIEGEDGPKYEENSYGVVGEDAYGNSIYFEETENNTYTAKVAGAGAERYDVTIGGDFVNGSVEADKTYVAEGETVTLTVTPDDGYKLKEGSLAVTGETGGDVEVTQSPARAVVSTYSFVMPADNVSVTAEFEADEEPTPDIDSPFTVTAVVTADTADQDDTTDGIQVYAGDEVKVNVVVKGGDYANADWTLVYNSDLFEYVDGSAVTNPNYQGISTETQIQKNVLTGNIRSSAVNNTNALTGGDYVVTYTFKAIAQPTDNTKGRFEITQAHVNNYTMAGTLNNQPANGGGEDVYIIYEVDDDPNDDVTPAGSIDDAEADYTGKALAGNAFDLDADYPNATVVYAVYNGGAQIEDMTDIEGLDLAWSTALPTWTDAGEYYYYVKVSGNGLTTIYDEAKLTIKAIPLQPTAAFEVDPDADKVVIIPMLANVVDNNAKGKVIVTYKNNDVATTQEYEDLSVFKFDGEDTAVGPKIEAVPGKGTTYEVTVEYIANDTADNYMGGTGSASVDVDKLTAPDDVVTAIDNAITNVFEYDGQAHGVNIDALDDDAITAITTGTWTLDSVENAFDEGGATTVQNVGDQVLVKLTFTDSTEKYNDVIIYATLKVVPVNIVIDVADTHTKTVGDADPTGDAFEYAIYKANEDGSIAKDENGVNIEFNFYGDDNLGEITYTRDPGEEAGEYTMYAHYVPNANYNVTTIDGLLTINNPVVGGDDEKILVEVVDFTGINDGTANYIAGTEDGSVMAKRLILVYTDIDKMYFTYDNGNDEAQMLYDVTDAGYKYVDNDYESGTLVQDDSDTTEYRHIYGIIVDADVEEDATIDTLQAIEEAYIGRVKIAEKPEEGADEVKPEKITYNADINCTGELDINDFQMTEGIYNVVTDYDSVGAQMKNALKADFDRNKVIDNNDTIDVRKLTDPKFNG